MKEIPHLHAPSATVFHVPSGFCTRVVPCVGWRPEGHTGLPDSKVGRSMGRGLKTCILCIVDLRVWFEVCD